MGQRVAAGESSMSVFAETIMRNKYAHDKGNGRKESWDEIADRVAGNVVRPYLPDLEGRIHKLIAERKFIPGGRYLYAAGRRYQQLNNCFLFRVKDSREGWAKLLSDAANSLMTGGGVGCVYSDLRGEGATVQGMGGKSSGPCSLMQIINEEGRHMRQGGSRRSALWAGLHWWHPDVFKFVALKDWTPLVQQCKKEDFNFPAPMDITNISIILDDKFFDAYHDETSSQHDLAHNVFWEVVRHMLKTGEPGFSVDIGENDGENLRNACTEVTSRDDGDCCNLGSINMARIETPEQFAEACELGTAFLLCGTLASQLPVQDMHKVREKNRRLGLGLMGVHEWLLRKGYNYKPNDELKEWMHIYTMSGAFANRFADKLSISRPVATRSIAPTGTISIVAETTSGIEPVFAAALKRRYLDGHEWKAQYIVDATAKRLIDSGVDPDAIEDAYTLAEDVDRRMEFQGWMQKYVDHGISSTINLPEWGSSLNNENVVTQFGRRLLKHLPKLRGITAYPDGARGGQPLNRVSYREAIKHVGTEFVEERETALAANDETCKGGFCNS